MASMTVAKSMPTRIAYGIVSCSSASSNGKLKHEKQRTYLEENLVLEGTKGIVLDLQLAVKQTQLLHEIHWDTRHRRATAFHLKALPRERLTAGE